MVYLVGCFDRNLELRVPSPRASPCPRAMAGIFFSSFYWLAVYFFLSELLQYLLYTYKALVHCSFDVAWHYHGRTLIRGFCCFRFCKANVLISVKCFMENLKVQILWCFSFYLLVWESRSCWSYMWLPCYFFNVVVTRFDSCYLFVLNKAFLFHHKLVVNWFDSYLCIGPWKEWQRLAIW